MSEKQDKVWTAIDNIRVGIESIKDLFVENLAIDKEDEDIKILTNVLEELEKLI